MAVNDAVKCRVAVVDDDDYDREEIISSLRSVLETADIPEQVDLESFHDAHIVGRRIEENNETKPPWDLILSDVLMPHPVTGRDAYKNGAFYIAETIEKKYPDREVPLKLAAISNNPGFLASQRFLQRFNTPRNANWFHFFVKGEHVTQATNEGQLMSAEAWERALRQLVKLREGERWGRQLLQRIGGTVVFISAKSIEVLTKAAAIGGSKSSLITTVVGETGVGKGIVSRLLHQHRMSVCQASGQFVSYPCSNSASLIIENELFGVKQGAYPGAIPRQGKFELAAQGTISLNQIQNLPLETQSKLIHVIDDKKTTKIGGSEEVEFTGHLIVCTTTSPLLPVEEGGSFSTELLRRMDTSVIEVPPLRKRREDILPLAERFLDAFIDGVGEESRPKLESDAKEWLLQKSLLWPKNLGTLEKLLNISSDWGAKKRIHHTDLEKSAKEIKGFYEET